MPKQSKRYRALAEQGDDRRRCRWPKRLKMLKGFGTTKFDQTVEIHMRLGIDPKQADQIVRGSIVLAAWDWQDAARGRVRQRRPGGSRRGSGRRRSRAGGTGQEDPGWLVDFDACIAAPDMMGVVGPLGRVLGSARLDAFAAQRHGHSGSGQEWCGSTRREKSSSATIRAATCTPWLAS